MRHMKWLLAISTLIAGQTWATETPDKKPPEPLRLIAPIQLGDQLTLKMWGWQQARDSWAKEKGIGKFQTDTRFNANLDGKRLGLGLVADLTYTQDGEIDGNYIRELYVKLKLTDHLTVQLGDVLLPVGRGGGSIPGPHAWKMIGYPYGIPYPSYGTGVKVNWENKRLLFSGAVTGNSGENFDNLRRLNRLELSGLAKRKFEDGALGALGQFSEDFARMGIFAEQAWESGWFARGEWDHSWMNDLRTSDQNGFYALAGKAITEHVEGSILVQSNQLISKTYFETVKKKAKDGTISFDRQEKRSPAKCDSGVSLGLRVHTKDELVSWKVQCAIPFGEDQAGKSLSQTVATEFQLRF